MVWQPLVDLPVFRVGAWEFLIWSHRFIHALGVSPGSARL